MAENAERCPAHPFLRALFPEHRSIVMQGAEETAFQPEEILFREGQPANRLYLLEEGGVALETHVVGKGDVVMATIMPGQVLGWSWLVPPYVWHFQARAIKPSRALVLNGGHLLVASEQNHYLGYELMRNISKVILDVLLVAHQRWLQTGHHPLAHAPLSAAPAAVDLSLPLDQRMAEHPFFHHMQPDFLAALVEVVAAKEFEPGQTLFEAGDAADGLYVIEAGKLVLEAATNEGPVPVQIMGGGDAFGWSSFCEPYEWQFTGRAVDASSALFFKAADIRERCAANYHLGYELTKRITRMMLNRLQNTRNQMWRS